MTKREARANACLIAAKLLDNWLLLPPGPDPSPLSAADIARSDEACRDLVAELMRRAQ